MIIEDEHLTTEIYDDVTYEWPYGTISQVYIPVFVTSLVVFWTFTYSINGLYKFISILLTWFCSIMIGLTVTSYYEGRQRQKILNEKIPIQTLNFCLVKGKQKCSYGFPHIIQVGLLFYQKNSHPHILDKIDETGMVTNTGFEQYKEDNGIKFNAYRYLMVAIDEHNNLFSLIPIQYVLTIHELLNYTGTQPSVITQLSNLNQYIIVLRDIYLHVSNLEKSIKINDGDIIITKWINHPRVAVLWPGLDKSSTTDLSYV